MELIANDLFDYFQRLLGDNNTIFVYEDYNHIRYIFDNQYRLGDISYHGLYNFDNELCDDAHMMFINKDRYLSTQTYWYNIQLVFKLRRNENEFKEIKMTFRNHYSLDQNNKMVENFQEMIDYINVGKKKTKNIINNIKDKSLTVYKLLSNYIEIRPTVPLRINRTDISRNIRYHINIYNEVPLKKFDISTYEYYKFTHHTETKELERILKKINR